VRDLILPHLTPDDGKNTVTVTTHAIPSGYQSSKSLVKLSRHGRYVNVTVRHANLSREGTPMPPGTTIEKPTPGASS
jgi:hypothetical protein